VAVAARHNQQHRRKAHRRHPLRPADPAVI
jgi:hypothetical protein